MSQTNNQEHNVCPIGPPAWHYKCRDCNSEFDMPVPRGPSEERERKCPDCGSSNIDRITTSSAEACPPGG